MDYYVIIRIAIVSGSVTHTPVGYVNTKAESDAILADGALAYRDWVQDNIAELVLNLVDVSLYFETIPQVYELGWTTNNIEDLDIPLIIDL